MTTRFAKNQQAVESKRFGVARLWPKESPRFLRRRGMVAVAKNDGYNSGIAGCPNTTKRGCLLGSTTCGDGTSRLATHPGHITQSDGLCAVLL